MNRRTKTLLPTTKSLLQLELKFPERAAQQPERSKEHLQARYYNRGPKDLPESAEGDEALSLGWYTASSQSPRSLRLRRSPLAARARSRLTNEKNERLLAVYVGDKAWKKATVTGRLDDRFYTVETSEGNIYPQQKPPEEDGGKER